MSMRKPKQPSRSRRSYTEEFKREAVQMLLDGHTASSICERPGLSGTNLLYRWKRAILKEEGGIVSNVEERVRELEADRAAACRGLQQKMLPVSSVSGISSCSSTSRSTRSVKLYSRSEAQPAD